MINNIPQEMRDLPQWVAASPSKVPLDPNTGRAASPIDPSTWGTFEEACRAGQAHVGFMLWTTDPYCIIDLDDKADSPATDAQKERYSKIIQGAASYTEVSASGRGAHVIVKATIPRGCRRDGVEMYSSERYMICTGNALNAFPIAERQPMVDTLFKEMAPAELPSMEDGDQVLEDGEVYSRAAGASNAAKFLALSEGRWKEYSEYESQSEADFALLSMFAFYSRNNEQVRRLFRYSALGKREKAQRDAYLNGSLRKIRAAQPAPVDMTALKARPAQQVQPELPTMAYERPPGLLGEITDYVYSSAIRPVPEVAMMASIALLAGIAGRSYNVSGTGLNQYLVLLAKTGSGKEGAASGIDALMSAVRQTVPGADTYMGPGHFASGQSLIRTLDRQPCFLSVLGEFGLTLQQICDPNAHPVNVMMRRVLLDLFSKSGWSKILRPSVYSDSEKNTGMIQAPNVTLLGESTPDTFYQGISQSHIAEGLIPRFTIVEYTGQRPATNPQAFHSPGEGLVQRMSELCSIALATAQNSSCHPVSAYPEADRLFKDFDIEADAHINGASDDVDMELWNRAHLKALKLAALAAVGCDPSTPAITPEIAKWAIRFVRTEVGQLVHRFKVDGAGSGGAVHCQAIMKAVHAYLGMTNKKRKNYKCPATMLGHDVVPFSYLSTRMRRVACFANDRRGLKRALDDSLKLLTDGDELREVASEQVQETFGSRMRVYVLGESHDAK